MFLHDVSSRWLVRYLTARVQGVHRRTRNDLARLKGVLQPGDVLLVEGNTRISQIIMVLTQSSWSHATLYLGDALLRWGGPEAERALDLYGADASHLLVESDLKRGVSVVPISKYRDLNLRVCRPLGLTAGEVDRVLQEVLRYLGVHYDRRNILDLARYLVPFHLLPRRWRKEPFYLGGSTSREVICSSLIARAFYRVGLSVLPGLPPWGSEEGTGGLRHPSYIMPRDFDLSAEFEVVKGWMS